MPERELGLYIVSASAKRNDHFVGIDVSFAVAWCTSYSDEDATHVAQEFALGKYPSADGWYSHMFEATRIPLASEYVRHVGVE